MKDRFSNHPEDYLKYRPRYPIDFYQYLNSLIPIKENAWDCGTGNGQVAQQLSKTFSKVFATDISKTQLENAFQAGNIRYSLQAAERTDFESNFFDLIIAAQAVHWFNFSEFYSEVNRTARKGCHICFVGYGRVEVSRTIDQIVSNFYHHVVGAFWDKERRYVDEGYETIPFPFYEIKTPRFVNKLNWSLDHFVGYLNTWSAVKHFCEKNRFNPIETLRNEIEPQWGEREFREVRFPLLLRMGRC